MRVARLVRQTVKTLPQPFTGRIENVEFVVNRVPTARGRRARGLGNANLYGLYEGIPLTQRDSAYDRVLPDRITIFWGPLVRDFPAEEDLAEEVRRTVLHEIAHYFGLDEQDLAETDVR